METSIFLLSACVLPALAYIPAQATNNTSVAQAPGPSFSGTSSLALQWYPNRLLRETVSFELVGVEADGSGTSKVCARFLLRMCISDSNLNQCFQGVLAHFSEQQLQIGSST